MVLRNECLLAFLLLIWTVSLQAQTVTFGYETKGNPPYYFKQQDDKSKHSGVTLDVLKLVAKRLNFNVAFIRLPWLRGLLNLKQNKIDGIFHASFKPKRIEYGLYPMKDGRVDTSHMLMVQRYHLYTHRDSNLNWSGTKFENVTGPIGALIGYAIVSDLKNYNIVTKESSSIRSLLNLVQSKRLIGLVNLENMTDPLLKGSSDLNGIIKISPAVKEKAYFLMLSHGFYEHSPKLAKAIWNEIKAIKMTGKYQQILNSY